MDYYAEIAKLGDKKYVSEAEALSALETYITPYKSVEGKISAKANSYINAIADKKPGFVQSLISQYPLKTKQGYAIMSLAECLDRVPDKKTAYELIEDKISGIKWNKENGQPSVVMNAIAHSLNLAAKLGGNAITYAGLHSAFKMLGSEFILGKNIKDAVINSAALKKKGYLISYDMLGEGARNTQQAEDYLKAYINAAETATASSKDIFANDGISIKLSALHPRYELLKYERLRKELLPRVKQIIKIAKRRNIAVTIDAEEVNRLELSLLIFSELYLDDEIRYEGLGLAVQAYQKAAIHVLEFLEKLAESKSVKIPVRLVKGAYWDAEIKHAQANGFSDYPVYTHKQNTDISYIACARYLLENSNLFYPQFGTHNIVTISAIIEIAGDLRYEFQKLYGMGDEVYEQVMPAGGIKCRIYAPVGEQKDLLAYLIRRLLENGANNSFLNQMANIKSNRTALSKLPLKGVETSLPLPQEIYNNRRNSVGIDIGSLNNIEYLKTQLASKEIAVSPLAVEDAPAAIDRSNSAWEEWNSTAPEYRAEILEEIANSLERNILKLVSLLNNEAKRNIADSISEIREAVDFCRYYAAQAHLVMQPRIMPGITGEENIYKLEGRGTFICISPWNFPLSIFTGQVVAALVSGNCVIAKPAEQTPQIAAYAVQLMHEVGVPENVLQLAIGSGSAIGAKLVSSPDIAGVCFTGSTETARIINISIAENNPRIIPLIAETGGQNCMVVDSTALIERVVDDMVTSAFGSAGQRCSALRVAYVEDSIADQLIEILKGAMAEIELGKASNFSTDVSEVIDQEAKAKLEKHIQAMSMRAKLVYAGAKNNEGNFVAPHLFEIKSISELPGEVFGPVLHIIRYKNLDEVVEQINSTGYGLTFGIQTRIASRQEYLAKKIRAGNVYANRSMIGAVVESQPFGGHGLSGTGPKAGGPEYLKRFCVEKVVTINKTAIGGNLDLL